MTTPGTRAAPYAPFTTHPANADLDSYLPGHGRTTPDVPTYLDRNSVFNIADFTPNGGALGVAAATDTAATLAAIAEATASVVSGNVQGAKVVAPPRREILLNDMIPPIGAGIVIEGAGARASRFKSSYPGPAFTFGTLNDLSYGCAIRDLSINLTDPIGVAIYALCTDAMDFERLYIEGVLNSTTQGIILDGGNAANQFTAIRNVQVNHVHKGLVLTTTGSSYVTSVDSIGFQALCDASLSGFAGSVGIDIQGVSGQGSLFAGGNLESCETGISCSGVQTTFDGVRFEIDGSMTALRLNANARGNVFQGCQGWTSVVDNSGNTTNQFSNNIKGDGTYAVYPANTFTSVANLLTAGLVTFGADGSFLQQGNTGVIANNGTVTIPVSGHAFELVVTDTASNSIATFAISPSGSTPVALGTTTSAASWSIAQGTASKVNISYLGGAVLTIENKTGGNNTVYYNMRRIRS